LLFRMLLPIFTYIYKAPIHVIVYNEINRLFTYGFLALDAVSYSTYTLNCPAVLSVKQLVDQRCAPPGPFVLKGVYACLKST